MHPNRFLITIAVSILCFIAVCAAGEATGLQPPSAPSGVYCGRNTEHGFIQSLFNFTSSTHVTIDLNIYHTETLCPWEAYLYNATTALLEFPNIGSPHDCFGEVLTAWGLTVSVSYAETKNEVVFSSPGLKIRMSPGTCES